MQSVFLKHKVCSRKLGGEEFMVILQHCDSMRAKQVSEEILAVIAKMPFGAASTDIPVTVSIGVSGFDPPNTAQSASSRS